jgi:uncharacterized repeat protein (TIGR03803 family)
MQNKKASGSLIVLALFVVFYVAPVRAAAQTEAVIHSFQANGKLDGFSPSSGVITDAQGALYGTTHSGGKYAFGTVFKLVPPSIGGGAWIEVILYSFTGGADGKYPSSGGPLLLRNGNLYGSTMGGGMFSQGVIFQLTPGKPWQETVLYSFTGGADGGYPNSGLVVGYGGSLYGTAAGGFNDKGVVFRLSPSSSGGSWNESVVYYFKGGDVDGYDPVFAMAVDASGALYGTTNSGGPAKAGVVFQLTPAPTGLWTESVLYIFKGLDDGSGPSSPLVFDAAGALYGTTRVGGVIDCFPGYGCGSVFQLVPPAAPGGTWTENTLHDFTGAPDDGAFGFGLTLDNEGALYGVTEEGGSDVSACYGGCGSIFKLTPPSAPGGSWTDQTEYSFEGGTDGMTPIAPMLLVDGTFYGTTTSGGSKSLGTVFSFTP